ncbi:DEAD/DEAH box helicase [Halomicrobium sp. HM KBTZ05]|uniref:DEAD/DEAH box helicase n=1 Tax=Halomicrobium sp. HM KBTZ05 TaxID=3242663 RepID=UPI003558CA03
MRHFDYNSSFDNLNLPTDVREILRATVKNKRLFNYSQRDDPSHYTTGSLRYVREERDRPQFRELQEFPDRLATETAKEILQFFEYENSASRFQLESWQVLNSHLSDVRDDSISEDRAAVISAPTGFGKTAAFLGPVYHNVAFQGGSRAIIVYPSRALLKDQLGRILRAVYKNNSTDKIETDREISVGAWMGKQPYSKSDVVSDGRSFVDTKGTPGEVKVASHWEHEKSTLYVERRTVPRADPGYVTYEPGASDAGSGGIRFLDNELVLHRNAIKDDDNDTPDILLTTLESLEILSSKPHYDITLDADYFIFDEIHQYQGLRGSHVAEIVRSIRQRRDKNAVYVGASATVENPKSFARKLFGFNGADTDRFDSLTAAPESVELLDPYEDDIDDEIDDALHYYFMLTDRDRNIGVASQYLQHAMMIGRSLLQQAHPGNDTDWPEDATLLKLDAETGERRKLLSFIQSKSQIHRLASQFSNADKDRELWQYHLGEFEGSWEQLASATGHQFQDDARELKNPLPMYSDADKSVDAIDNADIIHSTNFLEVGVDIDNLHFVSQYRAPENITTFRQRAGRAAREKGGSGHVFTHLSDFAGDGNFHYRADRFVDSDVTTPLRTENHIITWMHNRFREYYDDLEQFQNEIHGNWAEDEKASEFIENYFMHRLGWDNFARFLLYPRTELDKLVDISVRMQTLLQDGQKPNRIRTQVQEAIEEINKEIQELNVFLDADADQILLREDAIAQFIRKMANQSLELLDMVPPEAFGTEDLEADAREKLQKIIGADDPTTLDEQFVDAADSVSATLMANKRKFDEGDYPKSKAESVEDAADIVVKLMKEGPLGELPRRRRFLYYLEQALDEIEEYQSAYVANHGQLSSIKSLFRAAYYYDRCLQINNNSSEFQLNSDLVDGSTTTDQLQEEGHGKIWYIPPNYFNDAGKYFTLERPSEGASTKRQRNEKSITAILSQFVPFKAEHREGVGVCHVFQPDVNNSGDADLPELDMSGISGDSRGDFIRQPTRLSLNEIKDLSGEKAQSVYPFDETSYCIKTDIDDQSGDGDYTPAKLFAEANIKTGIESSSSARHSASGYLTLADVTADAWLEGVSLDVTPMKQAGSTADPEYYPDQSRDGYTIRYDSSVPKLGYRLDTRSVNWDLEAVITWLKDIAEGDLENLNARLMPADVSAAAGDYRSFDQISGRESICTTTAHLLTVLISDVAGISSSLLLYGYDEDSNRVNVFEQTEGGQGIVDLFFEYLEERPSVVLDSLYRALHNPQVLNERLWASSTVSEKFRDQIDVGALETGEEAVREEALDNIEGIVQESLDITYPPSQRRIAEEVASTLERIEATEVGCEDDLYSLKHELAKAGVEGKLDLSPAGTTEIPDQIATNYASIFEEVGEELIHSLFVPQDIDSCEINLQLDHTIGDVPQHEALSYCLLEHIGEYLIDREPQDNELEEITRRGTHWARLDNQTEEVLFLQW